MSSEEKFKEHLLEVLKSDEEKLNEQERALRDQLILVQGKKQYNKNIQKILEGSEEDD